MADPSSAAPPVPIMTPGPAAKDRFVLAALGLVAVVLGWAFLTAWTAGAPLDDPWTWRILLLASSLVDTSVLLATEWLARRIEDDRLGAARVVAWSALGLLVAHAALLVALVVVGPQPSGGVPAWGLVLAGVLLVANVLLALRVRVLGRTVDPVPPAESGADPAAQSPPDVPYVVACSGGGIRAAAFVLGGLNAIQALEPPRRAGRAKARPLTAVRWATASSPRLVAVSGGSYAAAAMSLTRRYRVDATGAVAVRERPLPWREVYTPDSPELSRLRRHTRDLLEPPRELALGFGALLLGAATNVFLAVVALRAAAWVVGWVATRSGMLRLDAVCPPERAFCTFADGVAGGRWWTDETVLLLGLVLAVSVVAGIGLWIAQGRINRLRERTVPAATARARDRWARLRGGTQSVAAGVLLVVVLLPALVAALNHLALTNGPTPAVASIVRALGFATPEQCARAGGADVVRAVQAAALDARISPGEKRTAVGGACGVEVEVALTIGDPQGCPVGPGPAACSPVSGEWQELGAERVTDELERGRVGGFTTAVGSLATFLALLQTLRRSVSADDGPSGRGGALRRLLLMRLPILVVGLVALWLLARWVFAAAADPGWSLGATQTVLPVLALTIALVIDANVTSMHDYYRARLHNAFAAARTDDGADAADLPVTHFYRFSELDGVPLTVATTANVQAYGSAPTRRGGAPLTVDERVLALHGGRPETERTVAVGRYEETVGAGYASIMSMVAMSGAAVSPLMGRFASTFGPFRVLLALFNIRVGVWLPNPRFSPPEEMQGREQRVGDAVRAWPRRPWFTGRPGAMQVVAEAFGQSSFADQWTYVTDGGHLDNTGIVEAVRAAQGVRPDAAGWRRVLALDASNDKEGTWAAVGDALAIVRADLGVRLERSSAAPSLTFLPTAVDDTAAPTPAPAPPSGPAPRLLARLSRAAATSSSEPVFARLYEDPVARIEVLVVKAVRPLDLEHADLPDSVRAFALSTPDFPRASTSRQDFSDLEFEAYRALGEWCTRRAVGAPDPVPPPIRP